MRPPTAAVFDCNVFIQAMLSNRGPAYACYEQLEQGTVQVFCTESVLAELDRVRWYRSVQKHRHLTADRVNRFISRVRELVTLIPEVPRVIELPRDPDDAKYLDIAIATNAMLVVTRDRDLLDLMEPNDPDGEKLKSMHPGLRLVVPEVFLDLIRKNPPQQ